MWGFASVAHFTFQACTVSWYINCVRNFCSDCCPVRYQCSNIYAKPCSCHIRTIWILCMVEQYLQLLGCADHDWWICAENFSACSTVCSLSLFCSQRLVKLKLPCYFIGGINVTLFHFSHLSHEVNA